MDWENHLEKNSIEKNCKNQSEFAACEKKTLAKKQIFVQTPFFHSIAKELQATKQIAFLPHFLFRRDQNHYSNLTPNIMKTCEQI